MHVLLAVLVSFIAFDLTYAIRWSPNARLPHVRNLRDSQNGQYWQRPVLHVVNNRQIEPNSSVIITDHRSQTVSSQRVQSTGTALSAICWPGAECDCSVVVNKNSEEYFQCVTNPNCENCWISTLPTTTTYSFSTPNTFTETFPTGTNAGYSNSTSHISPSLSQSTEIVVMTTTRLVTVSIEPPVTEICCGELPSTLITLSIPTRVSSDDGFSSAGPCVCDCSRFEDWHRQEYLQCLENSFCCSCLDTNPTQMPSQLPTSHSIFITDTASDPEPTQTYSTIPSTFVTISASPSVPEPPANMTTLHTSLIAPIPTLSSTVLTSETPTPTPPRRKCPAVCDCTGIPEETEEYFQCITNPQCARCDPAM